MAILWRKVRTHRTCSILLRPRRHFKATCWLFIEYNKTRDKVCTRCSTTGDWWSRVVKRVRDRSQGYSTCPSIPIRCALSVELVRSPGQKGSWKNMQGRYSGARDTVASNLGADGRSTHTKVNAAGEQPNP